MTISPSSGSMLQMFRLRLALIVTCVIGLGACQEQTLSEPELLGSTIVGPPWAKANLSLEFKSGSQAVLIELLGKNTNFGSRVISPTENMISDVRLAFLRSAPVYHIVEPGEGESLRLEIEPRQWTKDSVIKLKWYALASESSIDQDYVSAWRELAAGVQYVEGEKPAAWRGNIHSLKQAAKTFGRLGKKEFELWARYFVAYFEYFPLYEYSKALAGARQIISEAQEHDLPQLTMLGHQLAGQILIERGAGISEAQSRKNYVIARNHFEVALRLAQESENSFETIWSINNFGITSKYQGDVQRAMVEYGQALNLAIDYEDRYLINLIDANRAVAMETLGRISEAIDTLLRVESHVQSVGDKAELEHVWSLLGGYYLKLYEFPKALTYVTKALEASKVPANAEKLGRNQLLLGHIYREVGQLEKSVINVKLAIPNLQASDNGRGLRRAYALAADLHRQRGSKEAMREARAKQKKYVATDFDVARWSWSSALDALAQNDRENALLLFRKSSEQFERTPFRYVGELARLHACVLAFKSKEPEDCSSERAAKQAQALLQHQASSFQLQGRFLIAQLFALDGRPNDAKFEMDKLIDDVGNYRQVLPGVLGAWYWDARSEIFDFFLQLALESTQDPESAPYESLLALHRLRNIGVRSAQPNALESKEASKVGRSGELRELIARRDRAKSAAELELAQRNIDLFLINNRSILELPHDPQFDLRKDIEELPDDWSLLTYHLSDERALAWTATNKGLELHVLGRGDELARLLRDARAEIRTINSDKVDGLLEEAGMRLFVPIQASLRPNILVQGAGELSDFPLEAIIVNDRHLVQDYRIVNVLSLENAATAIAAIDRPVRPDHIFLAGNPDAKNNPSPELPATEAELQMVARSFPNASKTIYQQEDLLQRSFNSPSFASADLIHIASHASIDIDYPELSRIELSGEFLTPSDLFDKRIAADLVVLSACSTAGVNRFEYDSHMGFVSEFIGAGAGQVLATLWPVADRDAEEFVASVYSESTELSGLANSLRKTKLKLIDAGDAGVDQWAAFQLYAK